MRVVKRPQPSPKQPTLPDPRLPRGRDFNGKSFEGLHYERVRGDIFVCGVSAHDVGQGNLGDCYFLSSLAAVTRNRPDAVRRMVADNGDGTFTVTFKQRQEGATRDVKITVDADFPSLGKGQTFGRGLDRSARGPELWPAVVEKAYAAWQGGYQRLNQGGFAEDALGALTGKRATRRTPAAVSANKLWEALSSAAKAGRPMVTGTPSAAVLRKRTGRADLGGLLEGHAYALLGVQERGGRRLVELYTPLTPRDGGNAAGGEARSVTLTVEDYRRLFDDLVIGEI